ncbi:hypothetical protein NEF87_004700 [Candidatus Lokiarchaeum ossiferum]|uniref:Major facilitator superfamily (MFS) profile domain-containing protein n=1 Tax=Candidatus Lokiarchaeum ossiferum TaxID=2951803 RepID=A0ABY6HY02_9ARCH|nr:hypothetical protein NEF87_004700 [Candidatus Lokiarchaeum sp. B-35]
MEAKHNRRILAQKIFTVLILDLFILIGAISTNLVPSIYDRIQLSYGLATVAPIMVEEAIFIIISAAVALFWGYWIDKISRKTVLIMALLTLSIGLTITAFAQNFFIFILGRLITAIGFGAQIPASYSVLADIFPTKYWSTLYAGLALLLAFCNTIGNFMAGFLSPMNIWGLGWHISFLLLAMMAILAIIISILAKFIIGWHLPNRGASSIEEIDEELGEEVREGLIAYNYTIKTEDLKPLWQIRSNRWMLYMAFFYVIPGATMGSFLIFYFTDGPFATFPAALRTQVAEIFAAGAGTGYILGTFILGPIFDLLHKKSPHLRSKYTSIALILAIPFLFFGFLSITPVNYESLNLAGIVDPNDTSLDLLKYVVIVTAILEFYPSYIFYFILLLFGGIFAAPVSINRTPALLEINLPEHMGSSQGLLNCANQLGRGFTSMFLAFQFTLFNFLFHLVKGKVLLIISLVFYIPPVIWWIKLTKDLPSEIKNKNQILIKRTKMLRNAPEQKMDNL